MSFSDFHRELSAIFGGHSSLYCFKYCGEGATVIVTLPLAGPPANDAGTVHPERAHS